jgi:hypothetical protein
MPPTPAVRPNQPLERGQTTILSTLNGGIGIQRPPPTPRPGPVPKASGQANTVLGRRLINGQNEKQVLELFATVRLGQDDKGTGEPGDIDIANRRFPNLEEDEDDEDDEDDYTPTKRYQYSREHKLAAIDYFQTTWRLNKDGTYERISNRSASKKLKITRKTLRSWVANKERIQNQKRGTFRARKQTAQAKEPKLEHILNDRFEKARAQGQKISYKWMIRHAKKIYEELYPTRVITYTTGKKTYLEFQFSSGWYNGFRRRYNISLRCSTKRAQKSPKELEPVLCNWIQYNRRMLAIIEGESIIGIPRGPEVLVVGRIKLSEICNMDQSPLPFEFLKGRTYAKRGDKTIRLKEGKSGHDKRQCTLQIAVFADGVQRCKPLLMFKGKPGKGDARRRAEYKKYHSGVVVIFNKKAWANTSNLLDWVKNQYSTASAYPLRDGEPRFLALDAFKPHINKGKKAKEKESQKEKETRLKEDKLQQQLRDELAKLKVTLSLIPGGCTGYIQVLDVLINKLIKAYIEEYEDLWIKENFEVWESGKWSVGDRRILLTHWVAKAFERVHLEHKDAIIACFKNVGLSLAIDGSEDHLLKIRDLPNITVGDWEKAPKGTEENLAIIDDDVLDTIEVDDNKRGLLYTAQEVAEGITIKEEDENDVTTDSGVDSVDSFDPDEDDESDFDDDINGDEDIEDENM